MRFILNVSFTSTFNRRHPISFSLCPRVAERAEMHTDDGRILAILPHLLCLARYNHHSISHMPENIFFGKVRAKGRGPFSWELESSISTTMLAGCPLNAHWMAFKLVSSALSRQRIPILHTDRAGKDAESFECPWRSWRRLTLSRIEWSKRRSYRKKGYMQSRRPDDLRCGQTIHARCEKETKSARTCIRFINANLGF